MGTALAFLLVCAVIFIFDVIAEHRALLYVDRISSHSNPNPNPNPHTNSP